MKFEYDIPKPMANRNPGNASTYLGVASMGYFFALAFAVTGIWFQCTLTGLEGPSYILAYCIAALGLVCSSFYLHTGIRDRQAEEPQKQWEDNRKLAAETWLNEQRAEAHRRTLAFRKRQFTLLTNVESQCLGGEDNVEFFTRRLVVFEYEGRKRGLTLNPDRIDAQSHELGIMKKIVFPEATYEFRKSTQSDYEFTFEFGAGKRVAMYP